MKNIVVYIETCHIQAKFLLHLLILSSHCIIYKAPSARANLVLQMEKLECPSESKIGSVNIQKFTFCCQSPQRFIFDHSPFTEELYRIIKFETLHLGGQLTRQVFSPI